MLTDAFAVAAMLSIIERSDNDFAELGLVHGAAYLMNELRGTWGDRLNPHDAVRAMQTLSRKIIEAERSVLLGPDERPAVRVERAEAQHNGAARTALVRRSGKLPGLP